MTDDCTIEIEGHKFPSRLFLLTLEGFDIVLGMDWLAANEAQTAESNMKRGYEAYLEYVIDDRMKTKELKDVPMV
ncbi:hypothetical protein L1987_24175 [Smallanthus sonchifolius]|uniref:Uncharacterized protein n=1 Tax=Smallanthus sonchifolius TaxID=185202 RepID=A0ACB9IMB8_9ASTR|nr:hypothetical protein L1987_24175 [Smallanthus sonchifolius]